MFSRRTDTRDTTMATRMVEQLNITRRDEIKNWIARLESAMELAQVLIAGQEGWTDAAKVDRFKVHFLVAHIGAEGYKVLKSYCAPADPGEKPFNDLKEILENKLAPKRLQISEQHRFSELQQEGGEDLSMFMARVKEVASEHNTTQRERSETDSLEATS